MSDRVVPQCLAFIMDGNRRWAKERNLPTFEGHRQGGDVLFDSIQFFSDHGVAHVVYYAFSTENWNRTAEEVAALMDLFREALRKIDRELSSNKKKTRLRVIGRRDDLPIDLQTQIADIEEKLSYPEGAATTVWIALSYGGRAELIAAVNQAVAAGAPVDETSFKHLLWTADLPDPDMVVRTGGEQRLSNFLTWGSVYSELYFIDKHWPALSKNDFVAILSAYETRERRRGR